MLDIVYYTQSVMCRGYIRHIYDLSSERFGRRRVHVLMVITAALFSLPFAGFNRCLLASDRTNNFCSLSILFFEMNVVAHRCGHVVSQLEVELKIGHASFLFLLVASINSTFPSLRSA